MADDAARTAKAPAQKFGTGFLYDIWYFAALSTDLKPGKLQRYELREMARGPMGAAT